MLLCYTICVPDVIVIFFFFAVITFLGRIISFSELLSVFLFKCYLI